MDWFIAFPDAAFPGGNPKIAKVLGQLTECFWIGLVMT